MMTDSMLLRRKMQSIGLGHLALVVALGLCGCSDDSSGPEPGEEAEQQAAQADSDAALLRLDLRIIHLLKECPQTSLYGENIGQSSVLIDRLVDKLSHGQLEVLKRAREELAAIGAPATPVLRRLIEGSYANAFDAPYIENALGVANLMTDPAAHELLILGFNHPQGTVRSQAVSGLRLFHALPEDFDMLLERLAAPEGSLMRTGLAQALFRADRTRAEQVVLEWMREGAERSLWSQMVPELCMSDDPGVRADCAALLGKYADYNIDVSLAAAGAAGGDMVARRWIERCFSENTWNVRMLLVRAMGSTTWIDPLVGVVLNDDNDQVVAVAADFLALADGWNEERRDAIASLLDHPVPSTRSQALGRLVSHGDPEATDRAVAQLQSEESEPLQAALLALRSVVAADEALLARAQAALEERHQRDEGAPIQDRRRTIKAIGMLPSAWAADTLIDLARAHPGERLEGLPAHEWITIQAGNTGAKGRAQISERLKEEQDPVRRLDLIRAISSSRDDDSRELLLRLVERDAASELEVLYVADRLARVGPSHLVAPRLKRVLFDLKSLEVRRALSCLLWYWY